MDRIAFTVFTKPWTMPLPELGTFVASLGFDGVELPVRPGFQVQPERVETDLPKAVTTLADHGVAIASIAGPTDEPTIAACAEAGVPLIRVCIAIPRDRDYLLHEAQVRRELDQLLPSLERGGVTIGIQNHFGRSIGSAMGIRHLVEPYDPRLIGAVWDAAHCALAGEEPALAADILWSHLCLVNLKNAYWERRDLTPPDHSSWQPKWTAGTDGLCSWSTVAEQLRTRRYRGNVCLTAEYSDHQSVDRLIAADLRYARSLFG